jgi:hypothetical protein
MPDKPYTLFPFTPGLSGIAPPGLLLLNHISSVVLEKYGEPRVYNHYSRRWLEFERQAETAINVT